MRNVPTNVDTPLPLPLPAAWSKWVAGPLDQREAVPVDLAAAAGPTTDLNKLLELVRQTPDVRADVVHSVAARAAFGELTSRAAATETAAAFLAATTSN